MEEMRGCRDSSEDWLPPTPGRDGVDWCGQGTEGHMMFSRSPDSISKPMASLTNEENRSYCAPSSETDNAKKRSFHCDRLLHLI